MKDSFIDKPQSAPVETDTGNSKPENELLYEKLRKNVNPEDAKELEFFTEELKEGIGDVEEARERIAEMRKVIPPIISVPKQYVDGIEKSGFIEAHPTWTGHKILAGTLNKVPYAGSDDERVYFKIQEHVPLEPRFTGEPTDDGPLFKGVVYVPDSFGNKLQLGTDVEQIN